MHMPSFIGKQIPLCMCQVNDIFVWKRVSTQHYVLSFQQDKKTDTHFQPKEAVYIHT